MELSESVDYLGMGAFAECPAPETIVLPKNVLFIGRKAFAGCGEMRFSAFPKALLQIEAGAFSGCSFAKRPELHEWMDASVEVF